MSRKPIFDAVRAVAPNAWANPLNVQAMDNLLDAFGVPRDAPPSTGKRIGPKGLAIIKEFEGLRLKAYPDPATGGEPWTIGVGHTGGVRPGDVITEAKADELLRSDLGRFESAVSRLFPVTTQSQFDALVSLAFNVGEGNLSSSTLRDLHNRGDYDKAQQQFQRWNKANGKAMAGLTRRRAAEALLYGASA